MEEKQKPISDKKKTKCPRGFTGAFLLTAHVFYWYTTIESRERNTYLRAFFPVAVDAMEMRTMGIRGNVCASRVWKGEGEETEQFLACPL